MKINIPIALFFIFLILKLIHAISWSWWWITAPIWIVPIAIGIAWVAALGYANWKLKKSGF